MILKVNFKYEKEIWSFLNRTFTIWSIIILIFIFLVGYFTSDFITTISVIGFFLLIYLGFGIKTIFLIKNKNYYKKNGIKCEGKIKDYKVEEETYISPKDGLERIVNIYLIVEYISPYTNKTVEFITDKVNGNPFTYLSSLDVTVYALEDGRAYATDFKKINKLEDAVKYQEEYKNQMKDY